MLETAVLKLHSFNDSYQYDNSVFKCGKFTRAPSCCMGPGITDEGGGQARGAILFI